MSVGGKDVIKRASMKLIRRISRLSRKKIIKKFSDKAGLVYFGFVDQGDDEHKVVRGFTVSSTHEDNNYAIGSLSGYDISVVDRNDSVWRQDGSKTDHNWIILSFELHTQKRIPHFLLGANNHDMMPYNALFSSFPNMLPINLGTFESYDKDFLSRFTIYARPAKAIEVEKLFPSKSTRVISAHLWPLSAEQHDNFLYIYAANEKLTSNLLETMLENGIWLASHLDAQAELV